MRIFRALKLVPWLRPNSQRMPTLGRAETLCAKQVTRPIKEKNVKNASHWRVTARLGSQSLTKLKLRWKNGLESYRSPRQLSLVWHIMMMLRQVAILTNCWFVVARSQVFAKFSIAVQSPSIARVLPAS